MIGGDAEGKGRGEGARRSPPRTPGRTIDAPVTVRVTGAECRDGNIITDLYSDIAAELRARDLYLHLANIVQDPGSRDTLIFLGNREEAHAASFARALESIKGTIELPKEWFTHPYINSSPGTYQAFLDKYAPLAVPPPLTYPPQFPYPYPTQFPPQQAGGMP